MTDWSDHPTTDPTTAAVESPEGPYFGSVDEFVRDYLRHVYRRRIDGRTRVWSARWWTSMEAITRLEALWRAWEALRLDPSTGMSVWLRDHLDHHMAVLLDPDGPFTGADGEENTNRKGEPLPYIAPPPDLFPSVQTPASAQETQSEPLPG